jgi:hypothetical protein
VAGKGTLNAGRRKGNSPLQWDMFLINPPLKGLNVFRLPMFMEMFTTKHNSHSYYIRM